MKVRLTFRRVIFLIFSVIAIIGAAGIIPTAFNTSLYGGLADIGIILINLGLCALTIFGVGNSFRKFLFGLDFAAFVALCYFSSIFEIVSPESTESTCLLLLLVGGFFSWLTYVGIKYFFLLFLVPFKIIKFLGSKTDRQNGIFAGTKWVCNNCIHHENGRITYCGEKTITFKNGTPSPSSQNGCFFSETGKHNFVPVGKDTDINSAVGHAAEWIGVAVGFAVAIGAFIAKFMN